MDKKEFLAEVIATFCLMLAIAAIASGAALLPASLEAAAFNRVTTGPKVTMWDALWLDLRVEAR